MSDAYEIDVVGNGFIPGLPGAYGNVSLIGQAGTNTFQANYISGTVKNGSITVSQETSW